MSELIRKFEFERILAQNPNSKTIFILGSIAKDDDASNKEKAIVLLSKSNYNKETIGEELHFDECSITTFELKFQNDVYSKLKLVSTNLEFSGQHTLTLIYPASQQHIQKFSAASLVLVSESWELYETIVEAHVLGESLKIDWVKNLFGMDETANEEKNESGEVILRNTSDSDGGIVIANDYRWNGTNLNSLHLLAIAKSEELRSLRDLRAEHLTLLKRLRAEVVETVQKRFELKHNKIRMFFHYPPTFYQLHVHVTSLELNDCNCQVDRAHLLDDVIENVEMDGDYYKKRTLRYLLKETDTLFKKIEEFQK